MKKSASLMVILLICAVSPSFAADCHYELPGDFNYDCIFNLIDVAWVAQFWLIDCHGEPLDPECTALDLDDDGYDIISDCNDHNPAVNPGATEVCDNNIDDDCDSLIDCDDGDCNGNPACGSWWYYDGDMDSYGDPTSSVWSVTQPAWHVLDNTDCDDSDAFVNPAASEICDGIDNNCSGGADEGLVGPPCALQNGVCSGSTQVCGGAMGWLACDGSNYGPNYQPGSETSCDNLDNDCDGTTDEGNPGGGAACDGPDPDFCQEGIMTCSAGMLSCSDVTGDNLDICDGIDNDCDPSSFDGSEDPQNGMPCDGADSDLCLEGTLSCSGGTMVCSDATGDSLELCDGMDRDCDGLIDGADPDCN